MPRVLVTGGASGIGAATCEYLTAAGFEAPAADISPVDGVIPLDVTDEAAWEAALDEVGRLDGLVNCAGIRTPGTIVDTSVADFERHLTVNVTGTWLGIRALLRRHRPGHSASIVNIASVNSIIAVAGQAHYVASKGAVSALTKAAAIEGAPLGVRVNAIAPGPVNTPMTATRRADPAQVAWLEGRVPMRRFGEPEEVAKVARFLLSDESSYVTGTVVYADGGWVANA